jgi:phospholipid/cholesterol/gamma-HCH transport system permease protein
MAGARHIGLADMPGYRRLETASGIVGLFLNAMRSAVRPPYSWGGAWLEEVALSFRRCLAPLCLSMAAFSIGIVVALIAGLLEAIGTIDRAGGGNFTGWTREVGFWLTAMILAGVAGSAMTADLAARKVRDELDATAVLGVDTTKRVIVPRIFALAFAAPVLGLIAVMTAMTVSYFAEPALLPNLTRAAFIDSARSFINLPDVLSLVIRNAIGGFFVGAVCCYKGLNAKGGAEGVGRSVNDAVLITFVGLWILNSLWNAVFLANSPATQILRG